MSSTKVAFNCTDLPQSIVPAKTREVNRGLRKKTERGRKGKTLDEVILNLRLDADGQK